MEEEEGFPFYTPSAPTPAPGPRPHQNRIRAVRREPLMRGWTARIGPSTGDLVTPLHTDAVDGRREAEWVGSGPFADGP